MPPEEMTGSTHILEFMCYAIAGSAGIRFCMEMVMSSSSDASAQRRRRRVGRRRGVLRGLAGAALRAPLICMKGAAAPSPQRPRRTSRQASDASSRSSSMLNQASRLATPVQPSQSLASNKFSSAGIELFPPAVSRSRWFRSPPKFVVSLVVLQRTTERVV